MSKTSTDNNLKILNYIDPEAQRLIKDSDNNNKDVGDIMITDDVYQKMLDILQVLLW